MFSLFYYILQGDVGALEYITNTCYIQRKSAIRLKVVLLLGLVLILNIEYGKCPRLSNILFHTFVLD